MQSLSTIFGVQVLPAPQGTEVYIQDERVIQTVHYEALLGR